MKKIFLTLFLATLSCALFAQDFEVPENVKLEKAEDYAPYEQDVIKCVNWLINTPITEQKSKRKDANAFLLKWINGSPDRILYKEQRTPFERQGSRKVCEDERERNVESVY
jgi:hypothetical protein